MDWLTKILDEMIENTPAGRAALIVACVLVAALMYAVAGAVMGAGAP